MENVKYEVKPAKPEVSMVSFDKLMEESEVVLERLGALSDRANSMRMKLFGTAEPKEATDAVNGTNNYYFSRLMTNYTLMKESMETIERFFDEF